MTKSDYKKFVDDNFVFLAISDAYSLIDYIFEKGIEDKKTCEGCISEFLPKGRCESDCYDCSRNFNDYYEPKQ